MWRGREELTVNPAALFPALLSAKRGELELRKALGMAIHPEVFQPGVATAAKIAWREARKAGDMIHRAIVMVEKSGNVIDMADVKAGRVGARRG